MRNVLEKAKLINDEYRTAAMNRRYYACRLQAVQLLNRSMEVGLAVCSSASVATWTVWNDGEGAIIWKTLSGVAAIVAIAKPFLNFPKHIERYSELTLGYSALYFDMKHLVEDLRASSTLSDDM